MTAVSHTSSVRLNWPSHNALGEFILHFYPWNPSPSISLGHFKHIGNRTLGLDLGPWPKQAALMTYKLWLWERMLQHARNWRIWNLPNLIDSLFVLLIPISKNTQVSFLTNDHFWTTPFPFLSSALCLTLLIRCSLSLSQLLLLLPTLFLLL